ncbi:MAG: hypothetical protein ISS01_02015 [Nanoarchaeota archaeon]|nr:hypothetical protein [Nanoarchaeota archaeon]
MVKKGIIEQIRENSNLGNRLLREAARKIQEEPLKPGETRTIESTYERKDGNYRSTGYSKITIKN